MQVHDDDAEEEQMNGVSSRQVAAGQSGRKLMRLSAPEGLPTLHELQFRPGSSHVVGLTAQGVLCVVDIEKSEVLLFC